MFLINIPAVRAYQFQYARYRIRINLGIACLGRIGHGRAQCWQGNWPPMNLVSCFVWSQRSWLLGDWRTMSRVHPSGIALLASLLLLLLCVSPAAAFGAGNIGGTPHDMPNASPSDPSRQRPYPKSRDTTGVMAISRTCSKPLPFCKAINGIRWWSNASTLAIGFETTAKRLTWARSRACNRERSESSSGFCPSSVLAMLPRSLKSPRNVLGCTDRRSISTIRKTTPTIWTPESLIPGFVRPSSRLSCRWTRRRGWRITLPTKVWGLRPALATSDSASREVFISVGSIPAAPIGRAERRKIYVKP